MKTINKIGAVLGVVGVLTLGGCGTLGSMNPFGTSSSDSGSGATINAGNAQSGNGVVQSIERVHQANIGKEVTRFTIRMDGSGSRQTVTNATNAGYNVGDRVRIENGSMYRN